MNEILGRRLALACCAAMAFTVCACGNEGPGNEDDARKCGNEVCTEAQDCVDFHCVDKAVDACDNKCTSKQECVDGVCKDKAKPEDQCGESVDTSNDSANCGQCGKKCAVGHICVNGSCAPGTGETFCDGRTVDTSNDPANCGQCGRFSTFLCKDGDFITPTLGDSVIFGNYNGVPIEWYIMDNDTTNHRIMLLAKDILDYKPFDDDPERVGYDRIWAESTLRSWLNGYSSGENRVGEDYTSSNFISIAFTNEERAWIAQTTVVCEDNPRYEDDPKGGMDTWDWVFLLSMSEVQTLLGKREEEVCSKIRCTDNWWLRTTGLTKYTTTVKGNGNIDDFGNSVTNKLGVRPALWLNYDKPRPEDPCEAVVCPAEQTCIKAKCIDNACLENGVEKVCGEGQICLKGACVDAAPEETVCDGKSVNTSKDSANCGRCGQKCAVGYMCVNGLCLSGSGVTYCDGRNVNTSNDPANCGQCGRTAALQICKEGDFITPSVGGMVSFGTYDGTPIQWYIMDNDTTNYRIMLLSKYNLATKSYDDDSENVAHDRIWAESTIRSWLNGYGSGENKQGEDYTSSNFISTAFTNEERARIAQFTVVNEDNPRYDSPKGVMDAWDWVYLLSLSEVKTLLGKRGEEVCSKVRCTKTWWLRTPGLTKYATTVKDNGNIDDFGNSLSNKLGVRPALWLKYDKSDPKDPCEAVVCPAEQTCINAKCLDQACLENGVEKVCGEGQVCLKGACVDAAPEETVCDGKTVNTSNDSANCGRCGQKCAVGYMCVKGSCVSGSGVTYCDGRNVNTSNDPVNCGQCGRTSTHQICKEGDFITPATGGLVSFGTYNGTPIQWYILDNDTTNHRLMLLSMYNLEYRPYDDDPDRLSRDRKWSESTIRSWLNGYGSEENIVGDDYTSSNFISTAFTDEEHARIAQVTVVNEDNPKYETLGGKDTLDWVFLLSLSEAETLLGKRGNDICSKIRCTYIWWLRTPGLAKYAATIKDNGDIDEFGSGLINKEGVRPALWLNY